MTKEEKQKAIDALKISAPVTAVTQEEFNDYIHILNQVMDWLEQEPKAGHWKRNETIRVTYCSECGFGQYIDEYRTYNYCPNCGAKMESEV